MASKKNGTLYTGVTNNLENRAFQHKSGSVKGFTSQYDVGRLVYYESTNDISSAIQREKQIKKWNRAWKVKLIESINPLWDDLARRLQ